MWEKFIELQKEHQKFIIIVFVVFMVGSGFFVGSQVKGIRGNEETEPVAIASEEETISEEKEPIDTVIVYVSGAVKNPGVYELTSKDRVFQALEKAEPEADADLDALNLAEFLKDEGKICVPKKGESLPEYQGSGSDTIATETGGKVNINKGSQQDLETIPGVGPQTAKRILEYKKTNGSFKTIEDLLAISGIGEKTFEKMKPYITV